MASRGVPLYQVTVGIGGLHPSDSKRCPHGEKGWRMTPIESLGNSCVQVQGEDFMWVFNFGEHRSRKASGNIRSVKGHRGVVKKYLYGERHDLQK